MVERTVHDITRRHYLMELAAAPRLCVMPDDFTRRATAAGWHPRSIALFLAGPPINEPVLVGEEAVVVLEEE